MAANILVQKNITVDDYITPKNAEETKGKLKQ